MQSSQVNNDVQVSSAVMLLYQHNYMKRVVQVVPNTLPTRAKVVQHNQSYYALFVPSPFIQFNGELCVP